MKSLNVTVVNPTGLHTRPGSAFVKLAKIFESTVTVAKDEMHCDGKSLVKLLKMGIAEGAEISITCEGADEEKAVQTLHDFISNLQE
jgi:phosphocarrier protein HPr